MTEVHQAEYMPRHYDNGTYFCEEQQERKERGRVTALVFEVECEACLTRLARIDQFLEQIDRRTALKRVDWFGDGELD